MLHATLPIRLLGASSLVQQASMDGGTGSAGATRWEELMREDEAP